MKEGEQNHQEMRGGGKEAREDGQHRSQGEESTTKKGEGNGRITQKEVEAGNTTKRRRRPAAPLQSDEAGSTDTQKEEEGKFSPPFGWGCLGSNSFSVVLPCVLPFLVVLFLPSSFRAAFVPLLWVGMFPPFMWVVLHSTLLVHRKILERQKCRIWLRGLKCWLDLNEKRQTYVARVPQFWA